jgi:hypothetical protein
VEGLCGREALAVRHHADAIDFVRTTQLGAPFLFTKGNHDITGPGAVAAFGKVFHPFLTEQVRAVAPASADVTSGSYTVACGSALFAFFDAYEAARSLEWFEAVAARRTTQHLFVVVHPPVVPYGARSTWHIFSSARRSLPCSGRLADILPARRPARQRSPTTRTPPLSAALCLSP